MIIDDEAIKETVEHLTEQCEYGDACDQAMSDVTPPLAYRVEIVDLHSDTHIARSEWTRERNAVILAVDCFNRHIPFDLHARFDGDMLYLSRQGHRLLEFKVVDDTREKLVTMHGIINYQLGAQLRATIETAAASDNALKHEG